MVNRDNLSSLRVTLIMCMFLHAHPAPLDYYFQFAQKNLRLQLQEIHKGSVGNGL